MTSKQRIRQTMNHREPDRIPLHMNATSWVLDKLNAELGTSNHRDLMDAIHLDTFDMRGLDIHAGIMPQFKGQEHAFLDAHWSGDILKIWGVEEKIMTGGGGNSYAIEKFPLSGAMDLAEMQSYPWPDPEWFTYKSLAERLNKWSDYGIIASGCSVFQHATFIRGMDILMMDMLADPDTAHYILDRFFEFYYTFFQNIFNEAGYLIDIFTLADDLATQNSLLISPEMFETFVAAKIQAMANLAHQHNIKLLLHSDGNVSGLIPRFIELGVDILDPIQPEAVHMDPVYLKREYGSELCFRGGISAQKVLATGSRQDVIDETERVLDIMAPGGGYILSPGHPVLQDDLPVENILAMYETAYAYH